MPPPPKKLAACSACVPSDPSGRRWTMARDLAGLMHELGPDFAAGAARCDSEDVFVADNYVVLKKHGVLAAGIPVELGGGGAEHRELGEMLRVLARALQVEHARFHTNTLDHAVIAHP